MNPHSVCVPYLSLVGHWKQRHLVEQTEQDVDRWWCLAGGQVMEVVWVTSVLQTSSHCQMSHQMILLPCHDKQ